MPKLSEIVQNAVKLRNARHSLSGLRKLGDSIDAGTSMIYKELQKMVDEGEAFFHDHYIEADNLDVYAMAVKFNSED